MLIVTRKKNQSILIGDNIEVSVVGIENGSVKLAINAPKEIQILRKELLVEVEESNKEAAKLDIDIIKNIKIK